MNRALLGWIDCAMALEAENKELRRLMSDLVIAIARNCDLLADARRELAERFPEEGPA
jgi:hypothetical protein